MHRIDGADLAEHREDPLDGITVDQVLGALAVRSEVCAADLPPVRRRPSGR